MGRRYKGWERVKGMDERSRLTEDGGGTVVVVGFVGCEIDFAEEPVVDEG